MEIGVASTDLGSDLATVLLFIKSETQQSTTIVLNHLKDFSGFSVFKGKFQSLVGQRLKRVPVMWETQV